MVKSRLKSLEEATLPYDKDMNPLNVKVRKATYKSKETSSSQRISLGTHVHKVTTSDKAAKRRLKKKVDNRYLDLEEKQGELTFKQKQAWEKELLSISSKTPVADKISTKDLRDQIDPKKKQIQKQRKRDEQKRIARLEKEDPFLAATNTLLQNQVLVRKERAKQETKKKKKNRLRSESKLYDIPNVFETLEVRKVLVQAPLAGNVICFLIQLASSSTIVEYGAAVFQFCSVLDAKFVLIEKIITEFVSATGNIWPLKSESLSDALNQAKYFYESLLGSSLLQAIRNIVLKVCSLHLFSKDFSGGIERILGKIEPQPLSSFVPSVLESLSQLATFGEALVQGIPCSDLLLGSDPISTCMKSSRILLQWDDLLYSGLPVPGKQCARKYAMELKPNISFLESSLKLIPKYSQKYRSVSEMCIKLNASYNKVSNQLLGKRRDVPFAVILYGEPGVGKSKILPEILKVWSEVKGREFDDSHIFTRVVTSQYMEGYEPLSHPFIHYSELGTKSKGLVQKQGDVVVEEMTSLIDSLPMPLDMAALEKKGKVWAIPEMVIVDTNNPELNLKDIVSNPAAIHRRFLYVEVKVKDEFKSSTGPSIDVEKSLQSDTDILDRYTFSVFTRTVVNTVQSVPVYHMVHSFEDDIYKLRKVLDERMRLHIDRAFSTKLREKKDLERSQLQSESLHNKVVELNTWFSATYNSVTDRINPCKDYIYWKSHNMYHKYIKSSSNVGLWFSVYLMSCVLEIFYQSFFSYAKDFASSKCFNNLKVILGSYEPENFPLTKKWYKTSPLVKACVVAAGAWTLYVAARKIFLKEVANKIQAQSHKADSFVDFDEKYGTSDKSNRENMDKVQIWCPSEVTPINSVCLNASGDISKRITRNLRYLRIEGDEGMETYGLGVNGDLILVTKHSFGPTKTGKWSVKTCFKNDFSISNRYTETIVTSKDLIHVADDICMLRLNGCLFKDIVDYFSDSPVSSAMSSPAIISGDHTRATFDTDPMHVDDSFGRSYILSKYYIYPWPEHKIGECGKPLLLAKSGGYVVGGLHVAGSHTDDMSYSSIILKKPLMEAMETYAKNKVYMRIHSEGSFPFEVSSPLSKSPFNFERLDGIDYYGKLPGKVMIKGKSNVVTTPFFKEVERIYGASLHDSSGHWKYGPPPMKPFTKNGTYYSPWNICLKSLSRNRFGLDNKILDKCIKVLTLRILNGCQKKLSPLTLSAAINGIGKDPLYRRINASTSGGFGFPGKKKDYLPVVFDEPSELVRMPNSFLSAKLSNILSCFERGEVEPVVFKAHLKDEPRSREKNEIGKTRVFFAGPLDTLVLNKMFLSPFYTLMMEFPSLFCTAIGVDMHSNPGIVVDELRNFSPYIIEGDYAAFDQSQIYEMKLGVFTVICNVLESSGYNASAMNIVRALFTQNLHVFIEMNLDLFSVPGIQPSGKYGTTEDNSMYGLLCLMYAWYSNTDDSFFDFVRPVTNGDDMGAAVKETHLWFNGVFYADFCEKHYGMGFTSSDKGKVLEKFIEPENFSFLKRTFYKSKVLNRTVAPLALESIMRAFTLYIPSKFVNPEEQFISVLTSMTYEYFFHCTNRGEFDRVRGEWFEVYHKHFRVPFGELEQQIPSWDYLVELFKSKSN